MGVGREGSAGRLVKRCRQGEGRKETDGWKCEGGGRISTGDELCFRSPLPGICFHHADSERENRERDTETGRYVLQELQGG